MRMDYGVSSPWCGMTHCFNCGKDYARSLEGCPGCEINVDEIQQPDYSEEA